MNEKINKARVLLTTLLFLCSVFNGQTIAQHKGDDRSSVSNRKHSNNLINASSRYLIQHAYDPVEWHEWNESTLKRAVIEDKPILLSIGYSSCHWCHVMQKESFQNEEVAQFMNKNFVCIKVDREERPDIDDIYLEAVQTLGIEAGWPLNVFLTPKQNPFYGGTYFPKELWLQTLNKVRSVFSTKREDVELTGEKLKEALSTNWLTQSQNKEILNFTIAFEKAVEKISFRVDTVYGGTVGVTKFPNPSMWKLLLRYYYLTKSAKTNNELMLTLNKMAMGGIHDQAGGGFYRYSTDAFWQVPHFEKMLNDNAQLISLYAEAYSLIGNDDFKEVVEGIYTWLKREMTHTDGGFYAAMDADSEEEEGIFYIWSQSELKEILGKDAGLILDYFSVSEKGNWQPQRNILFRKQTDSIFCMQKNISVTEWRTVLNNAKMKLLEKRMQRQRPSINSSIISASNALMISGLADAYRATGNDQYLATAVKSMAFLKKNLIKGEKIFHAFSNGKISDEGFLDDYAYTIQALVALYQVTFFEEYLQQARKLTIHVLESFFDAKDGLFNYTSNQNEILIIRRKQIFDNVSPSSNSVMARNLHLLGLIFYNEDWIDKSKAMIDSMLELGLSEPLFMANWIAVAAEENIDFAEVVITGPDAYLFRREMQMKCHPFVLYLGSKEESNLPLLENKSVPGKSTIYICVNKTCKKPVNKTDAALTQLSRLFVKFK